MKEEYSRALIAFGSNIGDVNLNIQTAIQKLSHIFGVKTLRVSSIIQTEPVGGPLGQPIFSNGALLIKTRLEPLELLCELHRIEKELFRERRHFWGPRTIDLDLVLYDDVVMFTPTLTLPHPRVYWRSFVLEPALEIASDMIVPTSGLTIAETYRLLYKNYSLFELASYFYRETYRLQVFEVD